MQRTIRQNLSAAQSLGLERLDAQLLLLEALGRSHSERAWLLAHDDDAVAEVATQCFEQFCQRCAAGEPLAYIVGCQEFFGLRFNVDARVLVPRPDTETLVQWVLDVLPTDQETPVRILDLGTGSGAVALSVANHIQKMDLQASVVALDASSDALNVARHNALALGLQPWVKFFHSDWFEKVTGQFAIIASNPPYIASQDMHLDALVHEPLQALAAGADGLDDIRHIVQTAPAYLEQGGWLVLEHGFDQAVQVCDLLNRRGYQSVQSRTDLAGRLRCSAGQWGGRQNGPGRA